MNNDYNQENDDQLKVQYDDDDDEDNKIPINQQQLIT